MPAGATQPVQQLPAQQVPGSPVEAMQAVLLIAPAQLETGASDRASVLLCPPEPPDPANPASRFPPIPPVVPEPPPDPLAPPAPPELASGLEPHEQAPNREPWSSHT
jgi:hypothetical protein